MDETDFNKKYWHSNTEMVTVINPRTEDYVFQATIDTGVDMDTGKLKAETRHYRVAAGGQERFPGPIANMFLDQMAKLVSQDDKKFQFMIDFSLKAQYYDDLTVAVENLIRDYQPFPEYLDRPEDKAVNEDKELPFGGATYTPTLTKDSKTPKAV